MATKKETTTKKAKTTAAKKPVSAKVAAAKSGDATKSKVAPRASAKSSTTKKATATKITKAKPIKTVQAVKSKNTARPTTGFVEFLREQSVVGLAIGLIIGAQTKSLADQLIASFINPLLGLVLPGKGALDQQIFVLHFNDKSATFAWGSFIAVLLSFMTTAAVVYFVFKFLKLDRLTKRKGAEA